VTAELASNTAPARLRRNVLDLPQVVFQGITHIAPSINIVFTFPIIALKAGPAMPISFLLTTIVCFFIGNTVSQFSKYMPSSGGYHSFATRDIIPATGTAYHTTNIEDGVALADEAARADLAARYPEAWARIVHRREFMAGRLGIRLRPEVLPLSNLAGYLPPYWLAPGLAMRKG
jgi:amino acid transporter